VETVEVRRRNTLARDAYSLLHFPLIAGIVLTAVGLHEVLVHPDEPLELETATALYGGTALYLLAHAAFYGRCTGRLKPHRLGAGLLLAAAIPLGTVLDALVSQVVITATLTALLVYESVRFRESRLQVRRELAHGHTPPAVNGP
jgi:low temperature requirement protein LtrA